MLDGGTMTMQKRDAPRGAINLAPREPLVELQDRKDSWKDSTFHQILLEIHQDVKDRNREERRELAEIGRLNSNVCSGKLVMKRDPLSKSLALVRPLPFRPRNDLHVYPLAQINASQLTAIWTLARPRVVPRHFGNNNRAQIQHALIGKVIDHYLSGVYSDEQFCQQQSKSMMDYGTSVLRSYYDDKLNELKRLVPIIENRDHTVFEGYGFCRQCMMDGPPSTFESKSGGMGQCPECGSYDLSEMAEPQTVSAETVVGAREISQGDIGIEQLPVPNVNWDQRKFIHESSFVEYRSEVPARLIESILGVNIVQSSPDSDEFMQVVNSLGNRGGSLEGYGREDLYGNNEWRSGVTLMDEFWYAPEYYIGRRLPKDEITVSGEMIPGNVPLEQVFPNGIGGCAFNDMRVIAFAGDEKNRYKSGVFHIQSHSGVGKGTADSVPISEQLTIAHTASLNMLKRYGAGGGYAYDRDVMSQAEAKALLNPANIVGLQLRKRGYTNVQHAIMQLEHKAPHELPISYVAALSNLMNISFQTTEFTSGVANERIDVNTLGGQQMLQAQNQQRSVAPLRMKGYLLSSVMEDVLDIFRDTQQMPRFYGTNDKFALTKGRFIGGKDMPDKIKCQFVSDSEIPTNQLTKQQAALNMAEKSQYIHPEGFLALSSLSPRIAAWWVSLFPGADVPLFDQTEILMVCQERIDRIAELCKDVEMRSEVSGFFPDPAMAALEVVAQLRIPKSEENPAIKAEVIKEYLDDDEVKQWSPLMLASVEALIQQLYVNDRDNRFRVPMLDQEGQGRMALAAAPVQNAIAGPQREAEEESAITSEALARGADEVTKAIDRDAEEEKAKADHSRALELTEKQNEYKRPASTDSRTRKRK